MHPASSLHLSQIPSPVMSTIKTIKIRHKPTSLSPPNPSNLLTTFLFLRPAISIRPFTRPSPTPPIFSVNCSSENRETESIRELLSGMVDERVEELLNREENRVVLDELEKASQRVEMARKELQSIKTQEIEAAQMKDYVQKLESRTSEIAECQKELLEARAMVEEAERSLSSNMEGVSSEDALKEIETDDIDRDTERLESLKAALISAMVGTLAGIPISFSQPSSSAQLILHLSVIFFSCALFGVTFRYTIRRDLDNIQLKTGTAAAFSFVRGLAELEGGPPLEFTFGSILSHAVDGAVSVAENLFIFVFAAVGLDYCFKMRLLSPFPIKR